MKVLLEEQKAIEDEIIFLTESLNGPNMPGLDGKLVDEEGFPRADIDIHHIRTMRGRIACLKNDLVGKTTQIENGLHGLHSLYSA